MELDQKYRQFSTDTLLRELLIASERAITLSDKDFGIVFYNAELEAIVNRESDIRQALTSIADEVPGDELFMQFQPILDVKTNEIHGFEALARIRTQKLGLVSPADFIPVAEKTKLIIPIGEQIIVKSLRFLNELKAQGFGSVSVSINVSVIQVLRPDFIERLLDLISGMQVNPVNVGIELTESVFAADYEKINHMIEVLKGKGLRIYIDDFGTGYSSLAREKELKVNCLKIDKSFIDELMDGDADLAIASDIISMAHKLGHCVVAEGVEHEQQMKYLADHRCDHIQGYLVSRPLDEEAALRFLQSWPSTSQRSTIEQPH